MAHLIIAVHPGWHLNPLQPIDEAKAVDLIGAANDLLGSIPGLPLAPIAAGARGWQGLSSAINHLSRTPLGQILRRRRDPTPCC